MEFETIHTERLILRKLTPEIYTDLFSNYEESSIREILRIGNSDEYDKLLYRFKNGLSTFNRSFVYFQLLASGTGELIGGCGYHTWYLDHDKAELGYYIDHELYKNKGYMSEAILQILAYGFENMHLHRIEACVGPNNVPSLKLMEKFGFSKEGLLRQHYLKNEVYEDSFVFSLLNEEYKG